MRWPSNRFLLVLVIASVLATALALGVGGIYVARLWTRTTDGGEEAHLRVPLPENSQVLRDIQNPHLPSDPSSGEPSTSWEVVTTDDDWRAILDFYTEMGRRNGWAPVPLTELPTGVPGGVRFSALDDPNVSVQVVHWQGCTWTATRSGWTCREPPAGEGKDDRLVFVIDQIW